MSGAPEWKLKNIDNKPKSDIMREKKRIKKLTRHPVTQQQIDGILENELKELVFPVKPKYNARIKDNGKTDATENALGHVTIKRILIGKQDFPSKDYLIDTLIHEYFEVEILLKKGSDKFYKNLDKATEKKRHAWINSQIRNFRRKQGV